MQNKKKLHVITKYFYPVAAGIETNIMETYAVLNKKGWDVVIHTSNKDYTTGETLKKEETIRGLKVKRYKYNPFFGYIPNINYKKADIIALHNFNVVPHFWLMLLTFLRKIIGKKDYALIVTPHGGYNPEWRVFNKTAAFFKSIYHFTIGTLMINLSVDGVRAVSEWEKEEMIKKGLQSKKVKVISNGLEDEAFKNINKLASQKIKNKVKKLGKYIIQIGRIYPIKNYETTIKALPNIPEDIKYVIVGPVADKAYLAELKKLAKKLKVEDRVVFFGVVRGIDKYYLIKHAQLMVHMAIWESFCNVVHEGLSQGLPVIAANNTALPFLIKNGDNGYLVETKDTDALVEKINYVLKNKNTKPIKDMIKKNKSFGREHAWSRVAEKMNIFYNKLISK